LIFIGELTKKADATHSDITNTDINSNNEAIIQFEYWYWWNLHSGGVHVF